jgi:hypothetical protein
MGLVTITPFVETISFTSWTSMPLGAHWKELQIIMLEMDKELHPLSLNMECPHIIRAFKLFCKRTFGKLHPLANANIGLTHHSIVHCYWDQSHYVWLTIVVQDILDYKFLWFPKQWQCIEEIKQCHQDLLGLLGFDLQQQEPIIEKILGFMSKIYHRASQTCKKWEWHHNWKLCGVLSQMPWW